MIPHIEGFEPWDKDYTNDTPRAVFKEFEHIREGDEEILVAVYWHGSYEGDAFVLFSQNGKLYEVNGSHCSCYGLEGQWEPEETSIKELRQRIKISQEGYYDDALLVAASHVLKILDEKEKE